MKQLATQSLAAPAGRRRHQQTAFPSRPTSGSGQQQIAQICAAFGIAGQTPDMPNMPTPWQAIDACHL
jgi:hypothetical protein